MYPMEKVATEGDFTAFILSVCEIETPTIHVALDAPRTSAELIPCSEASRNPITRFPIFTLQLKHIFPTMSYQYLQPHEIFPFLSLPPDVRLMIYSFLLGGKTLHFNDYFPQLGNKGLFLCRAWFPDSAYFSDGSVEKVVQGRLEDQFQLLQNRHAYCFSSWEGLHVSFLQVCKTIHQEASLVLFKENTFIFPSREMAYNLIKRLQHWQTAAIQSVTLHQQNHWRYWAEGDLHLFKPLRPSLLPGLRHVRIVIELYAYCSGLRFEMNAQRLEEREQDQIVATMRDFTSARLTKVEVVIAHMAWTSALAWVHLTERQAAAWAGRVRAMLLDGKTELRLGSRRHPGMVESG